MNPMSDEEIREQAEAPPPLAARRTPRSGPMRALTLVFFAVVTFLLSETTYLLHRISNGSSPVIEQVIGGIGIVGSLVFLVAALVVWRQD